MAVKYIWQRLGKGRIEVERKVNLDSGRETLEFIREKGMVSAKNVAENFEISLSSSCHILSRLKKSGFLSSRHLKNKLVYFPTKRGFERLPREKGIGKQEETKIIKVPVEKEVLKIDKTEYIKEIDL